MMLTEATRWEWHEDGGPVIGAALHAGHKVHRDIKGLLALSEADRLREEDPYTEEWARFCDSWIIVNRSRFELDLNRPQAQTVYSMSAESWGQKVWRKKLPSPLMERSLKEHAEFYLELDAFLHRCVRRYGTFVILDLHSYNHRRGGPDAIPSDPATAPELNIGTGSMNREYWAPIVDRFTQDMRTFDFSGKHLDVRENVNFKGRYLAEYVHRHFPTTGCVLALEFKKTFMDEWSGTADMEAVDARGRALQAAIKGLYEVLASSYEQRHSHAR